MLFFGFLSALPLPLAGSALTAWLAEEHIPKILIGTLALFESPFAIKPILWPLINRTSIPFLTSRLGRRRSWAFVSFLGTAFFLSLAAVVSPTPHLFLFYTLIGCVSVFSGCVYLIGIAYEVESLSSRQYGEGSACIIFGYRLGLLTGGAGTLYMAQYYSWTIAYLVICSLLVVGAICLLFAAEPQYTPAKPELPASLNNSSWLNKGYRLVIEDVILPAMDLFKRREWGWILLFLIFYRIGDNLVEGMITPFYLDMGFSKAEIASVAKITGMGATIAGALVGGILSAKIGLEKALVIMGLIHAGRFLLCLGVISVGHQMVYFMFAETFQHFSGGMIVTAFIAALWRLTSTGKAAPQYALLWSALSIKTKCFAFFGGMLAHYLSWELFFAISFVCATGGALLPFGVTLFHENRSDKYAYKQ